MTYWLGIDLGTSYTAAAVCRRGAGRLETEVVPLGSRSPVVPSVLFLPGDGSVVVGEGAERRALTDPHRVVREFKRRIGDDIPLLVDGEGYPAHDLAATLVHWVWQRVVEREGEWPERVALTCPAGWGPYKTGLFACTVRDTGIGDLDVLTEPQAAAISYASRERVETGALLAVYDLGGGTFDAAVLRKDSPATFTVFGRPEGIEGLGGVTFDEAIFEHVCAAAGVPLTEMDPADPNVLFEVTRLRRECAEAKEALSVDTEATIPVALAGVRQRVRVTRAELEELIRPDLYRTVEALHRAIGSVVTGGRRPDAILLIGGSSRIPLVSQMISAEFGQALAIDTDPKAVVAAGAARSLVSPAFRAATPATARPPTLVVAQSGLPTFVPHKQPAVTQVELPVVPPDLPVVPPERPPMASMLADDEAGTTKHVRKHRSRKVKLGVAAVLVVLLLGAGVALRARSLARAQSGSASPAAKKNSIDPWTGQPWTWTTKPGPQRPASLVGMNAGAPPNSSASAAVAPRRAETSSTPEPTTVRPTTVRPTTESPTTAPPTTAPPTTAPPTTPPPTTAPPTTAPPTTPPPTTKSSPNAKSITRSPTAKPSLV
jgi:molecular chaperone DnaK